MSPTLVLLCVAAAVGLTLGSTAERLAAVLLLLAGTARLAARHAAATRRDAPIRG